MQVGENGSWVLPNVPANYGPVRARATCIQNGVTVSGQSDPFTLPANGVVNLPHIQLGNLTPIPSRLTLEAPVSTLTSPGQSVQLTATASYASGPARNVTAASTGTLYRVTNPALATISPDGLVTAVQSGTVLVQATNEGTQGLLLLHILFGGTDSDGDGIPDDAEIRLGLNPNDPTDALQDADHDSLTNLQEYQLGTDLRNPDTDGDGLNDGQEEMVHHTSPLLADTDGDGIPDGIEIKTGTDPRDPASYDLAHALNSVEVRPASFRLAVNAIAPIASQQLQVVGHLIDGETALDLTSTRWGTNYTSSDLAVCNFGAPDGNVFAANSGACTITAAIAGFNATAAGVVIAFSPQPLSWMAIPGYANDVDISGDYAYVAAGAAGLQIVDVSNRRAPHIAASVALPGNADGVQVVGPIAYVAAGTAGIQIVDVANPLAPALLSDIATGGEVRDLVVSGGIAYVCNGEAGLRTVNVADPNAPAALGSLALPGFTKGLAIDAARNLIVAVGSEGLFAVDVTTPAAPTLLGSSNWRGDPREVALQGNFAFVADIMTSLTSVDLTNPATPVLGRSTDPRLGGRLRDLAILRNLEFGADVYFGKGVPIVDLSAAPALTPLSILYFPESFIGSADYVGGSGIAADAAYLYLTAGEDIFEEKSATGNSRLYIVLYQAPEDTAGIPPAVYVTAPLAGATVKVLCPITVSATDDVEVARVDFLVDGAVVGTATAAPYQFVAPIPNGATSMTIGARAMDFGGNVGTAEPVMVTVVADTTPPTVSIAQPPNGATVRGLFKIPVSAADDVAVAQVRLLMNGAVISTQDFKATPVAAEFKYAAPQGVGSLVLSAQAVDFGGNVTTTPPRTLNVLPDLPPTVEIAAPADGGTIFQGSILPLAANAWDDFGLSSVSLSVYGMTVATGPSSPLEFRYRVPATATALLIGAQATDKSEQTGSAAPIGVTVIPDPLTTARGVVVEADGIPVSGARVLCEGTTTQTGDDGAFSISGLTTVDGPFSCTAWATVGGVNKAASSSAAAPVPGGITDVGTLALTIPGSTGRDFWLVNPGVDTGGCRTYFTAAIIIVSDTTADFTVSNNAAGFSVTGTVTPELPDMIEVPSGLFTGATNQKVEDTGIHVTASTDVSVFLLTLSENHEAYLGIPTLSLGTDYVGLGYSSGPSVLAVIASQNATQVTVNGCHTTYSGILNQGQTYNMQCDDASGAHVVSDKPVAVVVASPNGTVIPSSSCIGGYLLEMMFPVGDLGLWGTEIYSPPLSFEPTAAYRVTTLTDGTVVKADLGGGNVTVLELNHGEFKEVIAPAAGFSGARFTSNAPVLVMQYGADEPTYDCRLPQSRIATSGGGGIAAGPFSMQAVPVARFGKSFRFYAYQEQSTWRRFVNRAIVIAPNSAVNSVQLNGAPVAPPLFAPLPGDQYQYAEIPVPDGPNVVTCPQPITVYTVGYVERVWDGTPWGYDGAYGAPARF
jgi:hypothetical protein